MKLLPTIGLVLIVIGTLGLITEAIISFTAIAGLDHGSLPSASFLIIMIGIAFAFPSLLQDSASSGLSTMRIVVFATVLLFCTIYMKIGWSVSKYEDFTIPQQWVYILGLAFGSKAFQRFGEDAPTGPKSGGPGVLPPAGGAAGGHAGGAGTPGAQADGTPPVIPAGKSTKNDIA